MSADSRIRDPAIRWVVPVGMPTAPTSSASTTVTRARRVETPSFRILGPLEIDGGCGRIEVSRQKQKALLIALLLQARQVVSIDQLVENLWGASPPRHAIGSLHNLISALRKMLGARLLTTRAPGYRLELDPEVVDAHRFVRLVDDARAATASDERAALLRAALSLWRGRALLDVAFEPFGDEAASRLEATRQEAREELVGAELALGRHLALIVEIESLVAAQPFRERPRLQLMLALYRAGRQADAIAAFRDARRFLREELGLEPSPALQAMHRAILRQDAALDLSAADALPERGAIRSEAGASTPTGRRWSAEDCMTRGSLNLTGRLTKRLERVAPLRLQDEVLVESSDV